MALTEIVITRALTKIATDSKVIGPLLNCLDSPMPNVATYTMGGEVFWNTLNNVNGWRLQKNQSVWKLSNYRS